MAKKNNFEIIEEESVFKEHFDRQLQSDTDLVNFFLTLVEEKKHSDLNFAILNVGTLLKTISIFFDLKKNEMEKILALENESVRQRKITVIINEINEKINLKYGFDENTEIITKIYIYEDGSYMEINKLLFVKLLFGTGFMELSNMDNI